MKEITIFNIEKSLEHILNNKSSVARFGDGEIDIIAGNSIPYQDYDRELANQLKKIICLQSNDDFLVCLPDVFTDIERYNDFAKSFWKNHFNHYHQLYEEIHWADWYGTTFISRPYIDLEDKSTASKSFEMLKKLWHEKDLLIVEGVHSRSGLGNDLFDGAKTIERILCPSKNAFSRLEEIKNAIRRNGKNKLVLVMLGPTAKVIAHDLYQEGYQVIDLGHIDSEYEWYKMGATSKVPLKGKHTAEFNYEDSFDKVVDAEYQRQIVEDLTIEPLISVVVPVYNSEKYLELCIDSIINQTYKNLDILLINDGSTDNSARICENYAQKDKRIRAFHKENGGVGSSRNVALELFNGEYLIFVDNDDWLNENHVEKLYRHLMNSNADIAIGNFTPYIEETQTYLIHTNEMNYFERLMSVEEWFSYQYRGENCFSQCFTVPWAKIYKRELLKNIVYPVNKKVEDDYTTYKIYLRAKSIFFFNESIYLHRKRQESVTKSVNQIHVFPIQSIEERMTILSSLGMSIEEEKKAYLWRLKLHMDCLLDVGDIQSYKEVKQKYDLLTSGENIER